MTSEWRTVEIGSLCENIYDGPHATPQKIESGPVFLGISSLNNGRLDLSQTEHLSEKDFERWTKRVAPKQGDVVFSYETRLGQAAMIPAGLRCCLGRRMALMRIDRTKAMPEYVLYAYLAPAFQEVLRQRTIHGSTVDRIPLTDFGKFPISVPSIDVQKSIVELLSALDDRIALLREANATLEAIAQALFKSWFIDFDPVRVKSEGREPEGMNAEIAGLFPESLNESALGPIPKGWSQTTLGQVCELHGGAIQTGPFGSQLHASDYVAAGIPVVMPKNLANRRINELSIARIPQSEADRLARHKVQSGDIVFSRRGDVERHALIGKLESGWICGTGCLLVRPGPAWPSSTFLSIALDDQRARKWLVRHAVGATMPNLNTGILASVPLVVPQTELLDAFENIVASTEEKRSLNYETIQVLTELRDALLPRLISGALRLPDAEVLLRNAA